MCADFISRVTWTLHGHARGEDPGLCAGEASIQKCMGFETCCQAFVCVHAAINSRIRSTQQSVNPFFVPYRRPLAVEHQRPSSPTPHPAIQSTSHTSVIVAIVIVIAVFVCSGVVA